MVPDEAMATNLDSMRLGEADNFISVMKIVTFSMAANNPPLHRIFRFDHVELAAQRFRVCGSENSDGRRLCQ